MSTLVGTVSLQQAEFLQGRKEFWTPLRVIPIERATDSALADGSTANRQRMETILFLASVRTPPGMLFSAQAFALWPIDEHSTAPPALSPGFCERSSVFCEHSGVFCERSTVFPARSAIFCERSGLFPARSSSFAPASLDRPTTTRKDPTWPVSKIGSPFPFSASSVRTRPMPRPNRLTYPSVRIASATIGVR